MGDQEASSDVQPARATLEMDADGLSPGGALISAEGRRLPFSGWAEFGAVIEDWRAAARERPDRESA